MPCPAFCPCLPVRKPRRCRPPETKLLPVPRHSAWLLVLPGGVSYSKIKIRVQEVKLERYVFRVVSRGRKNRKKYGMYGIFSQHIHVDGRNNRQQRNQLLTPCVIRPLPLPTPLLELFYDACVLASPPKEDGGDMSAFTSTFPLSQNKCKQTFFLFVLLPPLHPFVPHTGMCLFAGK